MAGIDPSYIDVAERIRDFMEKFPEGSLQTASVREVEIGEKTFIEVVAHAYRHPGDERPGIAVSREPFPGRSNFTRDSEQENAETSAWGRAIVATGFGTKRIASKQEVQARQSEEDAPYVPVAPKKLTEKQAKAIDARIEKAGVEPTKVQLALTALGVADIPELTPAQGKQLLTDLGA